MQQREQLILKKLAEAREAQASAMTRFIQARARVMQVEARLRAAQARAPQQESTAPASSIIPTRPEEASPVNSPAVTRPEKARGVLRAQDAPVVPPAFTLPSKTLPETPVPVPGLAEVPLAPDLSALIDESGLNALSRVLVDEPAQEQEVPEITTALLAETTTPAENEEDTKKQPTAPLSPPPAQQPAEEEETLLVSMSALIEAREVREVAAREKAAEQSAEATSEGEASGTDITTKIPVIRRERREARESS